MVKQDHVLTTNEAAHLRVFYAKIAEATLELMEVSTRTERGEFRNAVQAVANRIVNDRFSLELYISGDAMGAVEMDAILAQAYEEQKEKDRMWDAIKEADKTFVG